METIWLYGWHVFESVVNSNSRKIKKIVTTEKNLIKIEKYLKGKNIDVEITNLNSINRFFGHNEHQGIAFLTEQIRFFSLKEWISTQKNSSFLIASDLIQDCHNLGAIIRTAKAFDVSGLLVVNKNSAPFNAALAKSAAGALENFPIIEVSNLSTSLNVLKDNGYKVYGLDQNGKSEWKKSEKIVLVLGQEGSGLRDLTKKTCDDIISINTSENFQVLNVSIASAIAIYEFLGKK